MDRGNGAQSAGFLHAREKERNRLLVREYCKRLSGQVWAVGDCAFVPDVR